MPSRHRAPPPDPGDGSPPQPPTDFSLPDHLRSLRVSRGLTLQQVGDALRRTRSAVHKWETGDSQLPTTDVPALAELYGVSISALFGAPDLRPCDLAGEGLLAYAAEDLAMLTEEDYATIRDFIEYRRARRLAERRVQPGARPTRTRLRSRPGSDSGSAPGGAAGPGS